MAIDYRYSFGLTKALLSQTIPVSFNRGYADSTFLLRPNEETMTHDAEVAYAWLVERTHPDAK